MPELVENWLKTRSTSLGRCDDVPEPIRPLVLERDGKKLTVRPVLEGDQTILVLAEEWTSVDPGSLACMGLTRREAAIAAWVSEGKTNFEIGQILGVRPLTVKKHLEHILEKLGMESRTATAGLVWNQQKRMKSSLAR